MPSPRVCIVVLTLLTQALKLPLMTGADLGHLPDALPIFAWPSVPLTWETLRIIALPAFAIAMAGLNAASRELALRMDTALD